MSDHGRIGYHEIPCTDLARAAAFYEAVCGWTVSRDPDVSPDYWTFAGPDDPMMGGLERREAVETHTGGPLAYVAVDDLEAALAAVTANGGSVEQARTAISGDLGWYALLRDPDGNRLGLWSRVESSAP